MKARRATVALLALLSARAARADVEGATVLVRRAGGGRDAVAARIRLEGGGWKASVAGRDGTALFTDVPPGRYAVEVEGVGVGVPLELRVTPAELITIEVPAGAPTGPRLRVVGRTAAAARTAFDPDELRALPSGRDVWSILEAVEPATVSDRIDTGGLWPGRPARLGAHGGSWTATAFRLGGFDVTAPRRGGQPLAAPEPSALASLAFVSAMAPVELPGSGPTVVLVPRRPGARWEGTLRAGTAIVGDAATAAPPPVARLDAWSDLEGTIGGPVARDFGLVAAGAWRRAGRIEWPRDGRVSSRLASGLLHGVWRASARDEVRALATLQDAVGPREAALFADGRASDRRLAVQSTWERRAAGGAVWSASAAYARLRERTGTARLDTVERLIEGPVPEQVEARGGAQDRLDLGVRVAPAARRVGAVHAFRFGGDLVWTRAAPDAFAGTVLETVAGAPGRTWTYVSDGASRWSAFQGSAWAADRLFLGRVALEAGLRADLARGEASGASTRLSVTALSPRLSAHVPIVGDDRLVGLAAWGRQAARPPLGWLAFGDPRAPLAEVRGIAASPATLQRGPGAPVGALDPDLSLPRTTEWLLALESRVGSALVVRFAGVDRRGRGLVESVQTGLPASAYRTRLVPDPGGDLVGPEDDQMLPVALRASSGTDRLFLTNAPGDTTLYQGVELTVDLRAGARGRVLLGGTAHRWEGLASSRGFRATENDPGLGGELFDEPNADTFARGRSFFDRAYTIKLSGTWRAPGEVRLGAAARYQDGQPFARLVIVDDAPQGRDLVRAVPNGRHRFAYTLTVDARAEKTLAVGRTRLGAALEAFNVLQTRHEVEEDVVTGPEFRTPTAVQPPRVFRASVLVTF